MRREPGLRDGDFLRAGALLLLGAVTAGSLAWVGDGRAAPGGHGDHALHAPAGADYLRRVEAYAVPDVTLVGSNGERVALASLLGSGMPVMLNFIFTSCTTICPVMTATFASVQHELGEEHRKIQLVSISIDPLHDTPPRLAAYAERQRAKQPWRFLTGEPGSILSVQEAFQAYRGDKMNHAPLTFLRAAPGDPWVRIQGFPTAADLIREYRGLVGD